MAEFVIFTVSVAALGLWLASLRRKTQNASSRRRSY